MKIGLAITGSFCTHDKIFSQIEKMKEQNYEVLPIVTQAVATLNTRFGGAKEFLEKLARVTGSAPVQTVVDAEPIGPKNLIDVLVIAPCTGNTLAKIANSITDNAVTMAAKSQMRNNKPLVIAISTNDALGLNMANIAKLLNAKGVYFVPFGQDEPFKKPKSLIADLNLLIPTITEAMKGKQLQPLLFQYLTQEG